MLSVAFHAWDIFSYPFTLSACVFKKPKWVSHGRHRDGYFFFHSAILCLLMGKFSSFTFKVIIDRYGFHLPFLILFSDCFVICLSLALFVIWWFLVVLGLDSFFFFLSCFLKTYYRFLLCGYHDTYIKYIICKSIFTYNNLISNIYSIKVFTLLPQHFVFSITIYIFSSCVSIKIFWRYTMFNTFV